MFKSFDENDINIYLYYVMSVFKALKIYGINEIKRSLLFVNFEDVVTYNYCYNKKLLSNTANNKAVVEINSTICFFIRCKL